MTHDELSQLVRSTLGEKVLALSGDSLFSPLQNLSVAEVYLMGLNPGGDPMSPSFRTQSIDGTLNAMRLKSDDWWALDDDWGSGPGRRLQEQLKGILAIFGYQRPKVFATNLIWIRSTSAATLMKNATAAISTLGNWIELATRFWSIHTALLKSCDPRLILVYGNGLISPFQFLRQLPNSQEQTAFQVSKSRFVKQLQVSLNGRLRDVVGVPHPSWPPSLCRNENLKRWVTQRSAATAD